MAGSGTRVGGAWMFIGQVVWAASQWAVIAVVARKTAPEAVGEFVLAMGIATPTFLMAGLGLRVLAAADVRATRPLKAYALARVGGAALAAAITLVGGLLAANGTRAAAIVFAVVVLKLADHAADLIYGGGLAVGRARSVGLSMVMRGAGGVVAAWATIATTDSLAAGIVAMAGWWLVVLLAYDLRVWAAAERGWQTTLAKQSREAVASLRVGLASVAKAGLPLGVVAGLGALIVYVPAYFLDTVDPALTGIYGALNYGALVLTLAGLAWGQAATPGMARLTDEPHRFARLLLGVNLGLVALGALAAAAALTISDPVVRIVYGETYAGQSVALAWMMIGATGYNVVTVSGYGALARGRFYLQPIPLVVGVAVEVALMAASHDGLTVESASVALAIGAGVAAAAMTVLALWPSAAGVPQR
ncbi:MAG: hypothetical protein AAF823_12585 [Planctomycetota bacterium]